MFIKAMLKRKREEDEEAERGKLPQIELTFQQKHQQFLQKDLAYE